MNLAKSPSGFDMCRRLLVVDDDPDLGELLSLVAQRSGYEVMVTTDYATFTDQYTDDIDVVVVDLVMPDLDGVDVIRFLADRQSKAGVIVASGVDKRVLRTAERLALDRGLRVLGSLSKPFPLADLRQLLTETVGTEAAPSPAAGPHLGTREIRKSLADEEFFLTFPAEDRGRVAARPWSRGRRALEASRPRDPQSGAVPASGGGGRPDRRAHLLGRGAGFCSG